MFSEDNVLCVLYLGLVNKIHLCQIRKVKDFSRAKEMSITELSVCSRRTLVSLAWYQFGGAQGRHLGW